MAFSSSKLSEGFVKLVTCANRFSCAGSSKKFCKPFYIDNKQVGLVRHDILEHIKHYPKVFDVVKDEDGVVSHVNLNLSLDTFVKRTSAVEKVLQSLREKDELVALEGWRDECYDVIHKVSEPALMKVERSATCLFGVKQYGVHVNGYTLHPTKGMCVWIGVRSQTKQTFPGKLDQMAAGGLASGLSILECTRKECQGEASVPDTLLKDLKPVGTVSYFYEDERGLFPECLYVYDLQVPIDFKPVNADGEMESFQLHPIDKVKELIVSDKFKFNCAVVMLEFLIRHGFVTPDEEPNYTYLVESMHVQVS